MPIASFLQGLSGLPERLGEGIAGRRDGVKALLAWTRFSSSLRHDPAQYDHQQRDLIRLGRMVMTLYPGIMIGMARDVAMLAEGMGDERAFRIAMQRALKDAGRLEARLDRGLAATVMLFDFYVSLMDFAAARRVAEQLLVDNSQAAHDLLERLADLKAECADWLGVLQAAHGSLMARIEGQPTPERAGTVVVHIPVPGFRSNIRDYPGFRSDIRTAFRQMLTVLAERGVPVTIRARLAKHGVLAGEGPYIAYHTVGSDRRGLHIKESDRRQYFSGDPGGYSGWASFADRPLPEADAFDRQAVEVFIAEEKARLIAGNLSKYDQPDIVADLSLRDRPYVFVALQVVDDAVQRQASLHMFDMLQEVADTCAARGIDLVVKRHPLCRSVAVAHVLRRGARHGRFRVATGSIHPLIANACAVCVTNSGVGAEALLHGRPVYTFGRAEYQAATFQVRRPGDFNRLFLPDVLPADPVRIEALLYALRHDYAVDLRDEERAMAFWRRRIDDLLEA
ncbi:hypothetical protein [Rhizobium halophytocola]|uniref:Capsular biosynthesis protein n=1 Tax=Rhizobium halophytocola TaxID=735519 RepID=A0ABS4DTG5_9HYPH|nr:hypothetical protein [Rhizobium halophytocola]MBP1848979.1 hypothetical protein [Rhizobium halophytocola]